MQKFGCQGSGDVVARYKFWRQASGCVAARLKFRRARQKVLWRSQSSGGVVAWQKLGWQSSGGVIARQKFGRPSCGHTSSKVEVCMGEQWWFSSKVKVWVAELWWRSSKVVVWVAEQRWRRKVEIWVAEQLGVKYSKVEVLVAIKQQQRGKRQGAEVENWIARKTVISLVLRVFCCAKGKGDQNETRGMRQNV